jgi:phosphoribosyl 1,2-cyclic phosphodiesterase
MTLTLKVLGSSSSGNCGLLINQGKYYLIDAGFSGRRISQLLKAYHITLSNLSGVFITHEHQDHIVGLKILTQQPHLNFYANFATSSAIESKYNIKGPWKIFKTGQIFDIDPSLSVKTFSIPHDTVDPIGFLFKTCDYSCAWVTDLGHITQDIRQALMKAQDIVFESNHDETLVRNHPTRPSYVKERILGPLGHLSNKAAFDFIKNNRGPWKNICLAHLSKDCNSCEIVKQLFQPLANTYGFKLTIVDPTA